METTMPILLLIFLTIFSFLIIAFAMIISAYRNSILKAKPERDYDKLIKSGITAQMEKLLKNGHKEGFENISLPHIKLRIYEEYIEFLDELKKVDFDYEKIRHELADIANFCHMGILHCNKKLDR